MTTIKSQADALKAIASLRSRIEFANQVSQDADRSATDRNNHAVILGNLIFRARAISSQYKVRFKDGFLGL
jgi:hypothetical protein